MKSSMSILVFWCLSIFISHQVSADLSDFKEGPVIKTNGMIAEVKQTKPIQSTQEFRVVFDLGGKKSEKVNRNINSLARFINMHVDAGVPLENITLAMVGHGDVLHDLTNNKAYQEKFKSDNPNLELVKQLMGMNVKFYVCGQSAAYHNIKNEDLIEGVNMSLSAMTAHALLQQQGFTLNPF